MTERQLIFGISAMLLLFGLSEVLISSKFILPLPLFEIILFFVSCKLWRENKRDNFPYRSFFIIGFSVALLLSRSFTYTFFLPDHQIQLLDDSLLLDIFYLFYLLLLSWFVWNDLRLLHLKAWALLIIALLFLDSFVPHFFLATFAFAIVAFVVQRRENLMSTGNSIWLYLLIFEFSRSLMLNF